MQTIQLSQDNYYTSDINKEYMSVSLFKDFQKCEAAAYAKLTNAWKPDNNVTALLAGNYVHSYFESEEAHEKFIEAHQDEMISSRGASKGKLKVPYQIAQQMVERLESEKAFQNLYLPGRKEVIVTGKIGGIKWRGKIDSLVLENDYFCDIKTNQDFHKGYWDPDERRKVPFVKAYGYYMQMAMYKELIKQTFGNDCMPFIFAVSKQTPSDIMAISFNSQQDELELENAMTTIEAFQERYRAIIEGVETPDRCGKCDYCRLTNKIVDFVNASDIEVE
ncbi:PD-(D/E)XK nuclease-like domain-containing protein [Ligilactobacillus sp. WILCCON 0076]|uniref:PD-(D/E)XK nuclease-like domain-containing protein n=1 Tax=Ligilactobacillus ubinensis TaxID=2876789 RepID=A0A9X2FHL0_9LACO|nr:PD-(D/E)XK nuclease-like domain-containing protein [Ligilactobacillus ubinensis]MCP0885895.1 PD-(D/E)XK nuclease-like domain-containing protein [Ligilactobacillus ubinensis]